MAERTTRYGATRDDIAARLESWDEPRYRAAQVFEGLWEQRQPLERITSLPLALRGRLAEAFPLALDAVVDQTDPRDGTRKWLWRTHDGSQVIFKNNLKRTDRQLKTQRGAGAALLAAVQDLEQVG